MGKKKEPSKDIQLEYSFDRLSAKKIAQAYQILIPDRIWARGDINRWETKQEEEKEIENSSNLCKGII